MPLDTPDHGRLPQGGPALHVSIDISGGQSPLHQLASGVLAMLAGIGAGLAIAPRLSPPAAQWAGIGICVLVLACQIGLWWLTAGHKRTRVIPVAMGDSQ